MPPQRELGPLKAEEAASEQAVAPLEASTPGSHIKEAKLSASKRKGNILSQAMLWQKRKWFGPWLPEPCQRGRAGAPAGSLSREVPGVTGGGVPVPSQGGRRARWARCSPVEKLTCER